MPMFVSQYIHEIVGKVSLSHGTQGQIFQLGSWLLYCKECRLRWTMACCSDMRSQIFTHQWKVAAIMMQIQTQMYSEKQPRKPLYKRFERQTLFSWKRPCQSQSLSRRSSLDTFKGPLRPTGK